MTFISQAQLCEDVGSSKQEKLPSGCQCHWWTFQALIELVWLLFHQLLRNKAPVDTLTRIWWRLFIARQLCQSTMISGILWTWPIYGDLSVACRWLEGYIFLNQSRSKRGFLARSREVRDASLETKSICILNATFWTSYTMTSTSTYSRLYPTGISKLYGFIA
jgi:hypothetical protein